MIGRGKGAIAKAALAGCSPRPGGIPCLQSSRARFRDCETTVPFFKSGAKALAKAHFKTREAGRTSYTSLIPSFSQGKKPAIPRCAGASRLPENSFVGRGTCHDESNFCQTNPSPNYLKPCIKTICAFPAPNCHTACNSKECSREKMKHKTPVIPRRPARSRPSGKKIFLFFRRVEDCACRRKIGGYNLENF